MKLVKVWFCGFVLCAILPAQNHTTYRIDTFAGGGTPGGEVATLASFSDIASLAAKV
jgi:hypothetical protein